MNNIRLNENNKRTADDFDPGPSETKKRKYEWDINAERNLKLPESANDRLKRLRNSLKNANSDVTEANFGWKPSSLTTNNADIGNKPQLFARRQNLAAIKGNLSARNFPQEVSTSVNQPKHGKQSNATHQDSNKKNCLNNPLTGIFKIAKTKGSYSSGINPRLHTTTNNTDLPSTKHSISNLNTSNEKFASKDDRELINTNFTKTKNIDSNLTKESGPRQLQSQRQKSRSSFSKNYNIVTNSPAISCNRNGFENKFENASSETQRLQFPNTSLVNYSTNNQSSNYEDNCSNNNTGDCVFNYSNSENIPHTIENQNNSLSNTMPSTSIANTAPKKISIQDRLKRLTPTQNNVDSVNTKINNKSTITSIPNNIFDTRNKAEIDMEPMEWADIDIVEVIQNLENMRKVRKFPPEAQSDLQHMLNANNTFAEKYQNPREDNNERDYYVVVDTNVFLSNLGIIKEILNINLKDSKKLYIYLPWMVIQELDYFKDSRCGTKKLQVNARKAIMLLNECLGVKGSHVKAQMVTDALEAKSISKESDDIILACCLQAKERNHIVLLLSNDTNLRNKAIINKISAYSTVDILEKLMSNMDRSTVQINVEQIELRTSIALSVVVEESLRNAYGDIVDHMIAKRPPYTLYTALELMRKYWVSVFSMLLQKQCLNTIDKLYDLISKKNYTGLPETEDKLKFVDLTLTLCMFLKIAFSRHVDNINNLVNYIQSSTGRRKISM